MIVRCSHCQKLLRVDENSLPVGGSVKVRCPHCQAIGQMSGLPSALSADAGGHAGDPTPDAEYPLLRPLKESPPTVSPGAAPIPESAPSGARSSSPNTASGAIWSDTPLPSDAFQSFRFPAQRDKPQVPGKNRMGRTWRLALWAIASLGVIGFFALLVNIVLPGPGGVRPAIHTIPPHERTSDTAVKHRVGASAEMDEERVSARR